MLYKLKKAAERFKITVVILLISSPAIFAAEKIPPGKTQVKVAFTTGAMIAADFTIGAVAVGAGSGIGLATGKACDGIVRNPKAQGKIMTTLFVGLDIAESIAIYALVVALLLSCANPFKS